MKSHFVIMNDFNANKLIPTETPTAAKKKKTSTSTNRKKPISSRIAGQKASREM